MTEPVSQSPATVPTRKRFRVQDFSRYKAQGRKLTMLTAYDIFTARIFDRAEIDLLLVGDSVGNNVLGYDNTIPVTLDEMVVATRSVSRGTKYAMVVADLPFGSYEASPRDAFNSAVRLMKEGNAHAVKLEGGVRVAAHVKLLVESGIPVVGHIGLTPQSENTLGGMRVQGRGDSAAEKLCQDALALQEAGACAVVLEAMPNAVAARVTEILEIPTIGIGAGSDVDGQVLVWTDMAGMNDWAPSFVKQFGEVGKALEDAAVAYRDEVRNVTFPDIFHSFQK